MKTLKYLFSIVAILIAFALVDNTSAQSVYFCEGVDDDGEPISESSVFTIPSGGGYLNVLVQLPYEIDCGEVGFEIYRNGKYENTITIDTEYNWSWFYKQITFYKSGKYNIEVYDYCNNEYVASGTVEIERD